MYNKAESKPVKVGEAPPVNTEGNTEPSCSAQSELACVETRRQVCKHCGEIITKKRKGLKYCSICCRNNARSLAYRIRHGLIEKPGVGSGGNQWGTKNHMYKTGIGLYRAKALNNLDQVCAKCGSLERLLVHHKDHDRRNNELSNLQILCKRCHQEHHAHRDSLGRYTKV